MFGEHWVVHGGHAIAAAVGLRARASAVKTGGEGFVVCSDRFGCERVDVSCESMCWFRRIVEFVRGRCDARLSGLRVDIESGVPPAAGLGSSAAVATAAAAAVLCVAGCFDPKLVWDAAFEAEKVVHGNPSGVDNTVSLYGGFIMYRRGQGFRRLEASIPSSARLVVVDTGVSRSTARAVEIFSERLRGLSDIGEELLHVADRVVLKAAQCLEEGDLACLGMLMDVSQGLLNAMGVSHPKLEEVVHELRWMGAYGAKLTGAGMGGSAIALIDAEKAERVVRKLAARGFRAWVVDVGVEGLRREA